MNLVVIVVAILSAVVLADAYLRLRIHLTWKSLRALVQLSADEETKLLEMMKRHGERTKTEAKAFIDGVRAEAKRKAWAEFPREFRNDGPIGNPNGFIEVADPRKKR